MGCRLVLACFVVLSLFPCAPASSPVHAQEGTLERAQSLLEEGDAEQALTLLDRYLRKSKRSGRGYLLRSTANFLLDRRDAGREDLEHALELDPSLRQGWLHLGALRLSEQDFDGATKAFERARDLDPEALDNNLNLGTTLLFSGLLEAAAAHLAAYVEAAPDRGEAAFLVAKNYALAGYQALAVEQLGEAIRHDERYRLSARTDNAFESLRGSDAFRELLETDSYQPPPGSYGARRVFEEPYAQGQGRMLGAVLDALRNLGVRFDPRVEVTPHWALIWSDMRIKVVAEGAASSAVELSAPPEAFDPAEWQRRSSALFDRVRYELAPKLP